jgi:hypothetical protein
VGSDRTRLPGADRTAHRDLAVADPKGWYQSFPGFGRHWVSVSGPYNQHLATDAGAGFLAVGVLLLIAMVLVDRRVVVQAALATFLVQDVPHFVFHLVHHEGLSAADKAAGIGGLGFDAVVAALLLLLVSRQRVGVGGLTGAARPPADNVGLIPFGPGWGRQAKGQP